MLSTSYELQKNIVPGNRLVLQEFCPIVKKLSAKIVISWKTGERAAILGLNQENDMKMWNAGQWITDFFGKLSFESGVWAICLIVWGWGDFEIGLARICPLSNSKQEFCAELFVPLVPLSFQSQMTLTITGALTFFIAFDPQPVFFTFTIHGLHLLFLRLAVSLQAVWPFTAQTNGIVIWNESWKEIVKKSFIWQTCALVFGMLWVKFWTELSSFHFRPRKCKSGIPSSVWNQTG